MRKIVSICTSYLILTTLVSCEKKEIAFRGSRSVNITIEDIAVTKAARHKPKTETIKQFELPDSLVLTVKVSDIPTVTEPETKGTNVTTSSFSKLYGKSGFTVYAEKHGDASTTLFSNEIFKLEKMLWRPGTTTPWPEYATDFYAWAPSNIASLSESSKSFSYTVPQKNENQIDLLVAKAQAEEGFEGSLHMTFNHALSEVKFTINENIPVGSFYSLSLNQLKMNGHYDFTTGKWTIPGDAQEGSVTLDLSSSPVNISENASEGDALTSDSQTFFVLPQTLSAYYSGIELQFKGPDDLEPKTYYLDFEDGFEFESNKCYTFAIGQTPKEFYFGLDLKSRPSISISNDIANSKEYIITPDSFKYHPDDILDSDDPDYTFEDYLHDEYPDYQDDDYEGMDRIPWHIKSYVIKGVAKDFSEEALIADGGLDVKVIDKPDCDGYTQSISVTGLARTGVGNHLAKNSTWAGSFGKWSPEDWSDKGVIDLSRMDVKKDTYAESVNAFKMTTANCYVIRHAGHYKFPLVYGNAMYKGAVNKDSYEMSDINARYKDNCLVQFVNHLGKLVTSPFIEQSEDFTLASGENACEILWQDQAEIVRIDKIAQENVEIVDADGSPATIPVSYIYITIPQDIICQNNALICVKDTEGKIVWSWHIWTTNNPALLDAEIEVTSTDYYDHFYFHPMNSIGWIDPSMTYPGRDDVEIVLEQENSGKELRILVKQPETTATSGMIYYQWGRKDPIPNKGISALGEEALAQGSIESDNNGGSVVEVQESILNPTHFFYNEPSSGSPYRVEYWEKSHYFNLWGGLDEEYYFSYESEMAQLSSISNHKTIYDPSPIGYKVPAAPAFSAFINVEPDAESTIYHEFNKGCAFSRVPYSDGFELNPDNNAKIFFAATGFRSYSENGMVKESNSVLGYWYSTIYSGIPFVETMYDYETIKIPFAFFDENGLDMTDDIKTVRLKKIFTERYLDYYKILFDCEYNLGNGFPVRPILNERVDNETDFKGDTVEPYENEYYTIVG